jgi:hypothetical protein
VRERESIPLRTDSVDFVDKDDRRRVVRRHLEQLADELGTVSEVLLDELGTDDAKEGGRRLVRDCLGKERLAGSRNAVQDDTWEGFESAAAAPITPRVLEPYL